MFHFHLFLGILVCLNASMWLGNKRSAFSVFQILGKEMIFGSLNVVPLYRCSLAPFEAAEKLEEMDDDETLPSELVRRFKEISKLAKIIYLKGPSGNIWELKLAKKAGQLYLEDGWKDFIKDHYVKEDDRLVFKYCLKSCFTVLIFDTSGCERIASHFANNKKVSASPKVLQAQNLSTSQSLGVTECSFEREESHNNTELQLLSDDSIFSGGSFSFESDQTFKSSRFGKHCINTNASEFLSCPKRRPGIKDTGSIAEEKAHRLVESISKRNPCFVKVLPSSSVINKTALGIPRDVVVKCKLFKYQSIVLQTSYRQKWLVYHSFSQSSTSMLFWKNFVKDNSLKEGDVCVFELAASRSKMTMFVYIFRK